MKLIRFWVSCQMESIEGENVTRIMRALLSSIWFKTKVAMVNQVIDNVGQVVAIQLAASTRPDCYEILSFFILILAWLISAVFTLLTIALSCVSATTLPQGLVDWSQLSFIQQRLLGLSRPTHAWGHIRKGHILLLFFFFFYIFLCADLSKAKE